MGPLGAVFFDLDDVLLDYGYRMRTRLRATYEAAAGQLPGDLRSRAIDASIALVGDLMGRHAWAEAQQIDWFARPLAALGVHDPDLPGLLCDELNSRYDQSNREHPAAARLLAACRGLPRCLITNGFGRIQRPKLEQLGYATGVFNEIFISEEHGIWKPDPKIFKLALAASRTAPAQTVMIGDNPYTDIAGANAAGLCSLWINHSQLKLDRDGPVPTWEVASVAQAANLLESLLKR